MLGRLAGRCLAAGQMAWLREARWLSAADAPEVPIVAASVVVRAPLLKPLPEDWEAEYNNWSMKRRMGHMKILPREFLEGGGREGKEGDEGAEDEQELTAWRPNPRVTPADAAGDTRSLMRRLDDFLFLMVRDGRDGAWGFPSEVNAGEAVVETGRRALEAKVGGDLDVNFKSNCPMGHIVREGKDPGKVFFMEAQVMGGQVGPRGLEYAWVAKDEFRKFIEDEALLGLLGRMLPSRVPPNYFTLWDYFPFVREGAGERQEVA